MEIHKHVNRLSQKLSLSAKWAVHEHKIERKNKTTMQARVLYAHKLFDRSLRSSGTAEKKKTQMKRNEVKWWGNETKKKYDAKIKKKHKKWMSARDVNFLLE